MTKEEIIEKKWLKNSKVKIVKEPDGWAIFLNAETMDSFAGNPISLFIWENINGRNCSKSLSNLVRDTFEDVPSTVEAEIADFLNTLKTYGMIS
jgi:hypothetical protein